MRKREARSGRMSRRLCEYNGKPKEKNRCPKNQTGDGGSSGEGAGYVQKEDTMTP
ncbi:hypothetical protein [Paenibacillus sp. KS1]|uniref:hypothetical protein n=1 Tax=Paenibacillus sp. KS1 TaxID=1849249 RepID=UPI0015865E26|nr:hypothetical protein [Paenibacillus sp. KS1]